MPQFNRVDSNKPLIADLSFLLSDKQSVVLPAHEYVQSIEVVQLAQGGWTGKLVLFDAEGDFIDSLVLAAGIGARVAFRFGFDTGNIEDNPLHIGLVVKYVPEFEPQGVTLEIELVSSVVLTAVLDRQDRSFPAGMTASAIVREIAATRGWRLVDRFGNSTIEDSVGALNEFPMTGESDINFITDRLLDRAVNAEGHGFVFFIDTDEAVHFHSINKTTATNGASYVLAKSYVFSRDSHGEVISFKPSDDVIASYLHGGGNVQYTGVDSLGGSAAELDIKALTGPPDSVATIKAGAGFRNAPGKKLSARVYVTARDAAERIMLTESLWTKMAAVAYSAEIEVLGTHALRPEDYVLVQYVKKNGLDHYLGGTFKVHSVEQRWSSAGWTTSMALTRYGTNFTAESAKFDAKKSATVAPGATTDTAGGGSSQTVQIGSDLPRRIKTLTP